MPKRVKVVTAGETAPVPVKRRVVVSESNPKISGFTENEVKVRRYASTTSFNMRTSADVLNSYGGNFYSPQLSTDFLEKPQNLRERRAFYRFFYNTNEIIGQAIDIHSTLPLSKLRLVPPKGKNKHMNDYVFKFFKDMCDNMKLFKSLIDMAHEYMLFGNCLSKNANVRTIEGYKRADEVMVGDLVLTHKGRYRKVIRSFCRISDKIYKIRCLRDYRELELTQEHPVEVIQDGQFVFKKVEDLKKDDYIRVTWPIEVADIDHVSLQYPEYYEILDDGVILKFKVPHPRSLLVSKAKRCIIKWLNSLKEPTIKTRLELAESFDVPLSVLNTAIHYLNKELDCIFHRRLGAKGWQQGSQVAWYPIDMDVEVFDEYVIYKKRFLKAVKGFDIDNDFAYLLGFWIGDGTLSRDSSRNTWGRGLWQISNKNPDNINRIHNILIKIFGPEAIKKWDSEGMTFLKVISNPAFIEWWADNFGETSLKRNKKKIPEWFIKLPQEKLKYFLSGILDSDGSVGLEGSRDTFCLSISLVSKNLTDAIKDIALKCGAFSSYRKAEPRKVSLPNGKDAMSKEMYVLNFRSEEAVSVFLEHANKKLPEDVVFVDEQKGYKMIGTDIALKIKKIKEEKYDDTVYNFEVEEDHTFQVDGFSTHNCFAYCQEHDWKDSMSPEEQGRKKKEILQRAEFLKREFDITDKNPLFKGYEKIIILPPDQVRVRKLPLTDDVAIEYLPDAETRRFLSSDMPLDINDPTRNIKYEFPKELKEKLMTSGAIPLDTDPYSGSHVYHLARKKSQYEPLGVSIVERCINTLVLMDKLRQAQTSIASRHMTPMRIVWSEGLNPEDVDNLREQVDMALVDPDYSIIANYEIHWEEMGSNGRLLDIDAENESNLNRLLAGLGMTREILTGEGSYTGSRISLEIMNTQYLLFREVLQEFVENNLFKPIAVKKGFVEYDEYGNENVLYPKLSFTRLAIRDNDQFFDAAFQLYQKGSISIDLILDILNIDPDSTKEKIEKDMFTVNDSLFNEVLRNLYTSAAAPLVEKTDVVQRLADYMKLDMVPEAESPEGASRFSSDKSNPDLNIKLIKVMKYLKSKPELLEKIFQNGTKSCNPSQTT